MVFGKVKFRWDLLYHLYPPTTEMAETKSTAGATKSKLGENRSNRLLNVESLLRGGKHSSINLTKEDEEITYKTMRALAPKIRNIEPKKVSRETLLLTKDSSSLNKVDLSSERRLPRGEGLPTKVASIEQAAFPHSENGVSPAEPSKKEVRLLTKGKDVGLFKPRTPRTFSLIEVQHDPFETVSKEMTYRLFVDQYLSSKGVESKGSVFLDKYLRSLEIMTLKKVEFYEGYMTELGHTIESTMKNIEDLKQMGITPDENEWFPSLRQSWLTFSKVKTLVSKLKSSRPSREEVQEGFMRAFFDPHRGLDRIVGRDDFKDFLVRGVFAMAYNPKSFDGFNNMIFYGGPGIGKTVMAQTVSWFYQNLYILDSPQSRTCTAADLVGQYLGQTAPLTRAVLMDTLGGVLFIDEAYGIGTHIYGSEALSEIVNFLDKLMGKSIVILAGYEEEMKKVVSHNPGLLRRFPHSFTLSPFTPEELTSIFIDRLSELLPSSSESLLTLSEEVANTFFTLITKGVERGKFVNQAGDMLNLAGRLVSKLFSSTSASSSPSAREIINVAIDLLE